jgi:DNA-binding MarR family transcriptional regulator
VAKDIISEINDACLLMRTRLIARVMTGIYDDDLRPFGINSPQFALLAVIHNMGPSSRAEIGRFHRQDRSTLTRNLQVMMSEGWLEEIDNEAGGRSRPIVLTKAGKALLHDAAPAWRKSQAKAKAILGKDGAAAIMKVANSMISQSKTI